MIEARPLETFTAYLVPAPAGLTNVGVRVVKGDGEVVIARTETGVVEIEIEGSDSSAYSIEGLVAPALRGRYLVLWDDLDSGDLGGDDLRVAYGRIVDPDASTFITVDDLAAYMSPRAPRDLSEDLLAELAVEGACALIRTLTEQDLDLVVDDSAVFSGRGTSWHLLLPQLPVVEIDEVRIDDETVLDWELRRGGVLRSTDAKWPEGNANIEVDYSHGFAVIPTELRLLALAIAARSYQQGIARQETTGGSSVTWSTPSSLDLSSGEKTIISRYRVRGESGAALVDAAPAVS